MKFSPFRQISRGKKKEKESHTALHGTRGVVLAFLSNLRHSTFWQNFLVLSSSFLQLASRCFTPLVAFATLFVYVVASLPAFSPPEFLKNDLTATTANVKRGRSTRVFRSYDAFLERKTRPAT